MRKTAGSSIWNRSEYVGPWRATRLSRPDGARNRRSMKITIKKIVYPGRSLAEAGGKVVFTDEGLPGEIEARPLADVLVEGPSGAPLRR